MSGLVKHYKNTMKNIPQLSNTWGSMIGLLDAVLVSGFNYVPVVSISKAVDSITATINVGAGHGFIDRQVVRISGSTNGWDGDYKVLAANTANILVECAASLPTSITGVASCLTAPLDFEIVFSTPQGSAEPKRAYRSKDPNSLGLILLVHDFCVSGAAATGAKFAKVGVVSGMSDIDNITGIQMPFDSANPNANWGWDGTSHGWTKWYYAMPSYVNTYDTRNDGNTASAGDRSFYAVGSSKSFLLNISEFVVSAAYGFLEFFDYTHQGLNIALLATNANGGQVPQSTSIFANGRAGYGFVQNSASYGVNSYNQRALLWFDTSGQVKPNLAGPYLYAAARQTGNSTDATLAASVSSNQHAFLQEYFLDSSNNVRGVLPFLRKPLRFVSEEVITTDGKHAIFSYTDRGYYKYAISLESE